MMLLWWAMAIVAQPPIEWTAPEPCPTAEQVKDKLADVLGDGAPMQTEIEASGHVSQADGRFRLQLELRSPTGSRSRSLEAVSCEELTNVAVLLIAVAVDPGIAARLPAIAEQLAAPVPAAPEPAEPVEEAEPARAEPALAEVEDEVVAPDPAPALPEPAVAGPSAPASDLARTPAMRPVAAPISAPSQRRTTALLSVGTGLHIGTLPMPTPAARVSLGLMWGALRVEFGATHRFESSAPPTEGVRISISSTVGDVAVCGVPRSGAVEFPFCFGVEAGAISGRTRSAIAPAHGRAPWIAARGGAGVVVKPWSRFGFTVDVDAVIPLAHTSFEVVGLGALFRTPPAGADIMIGTLLRFP